MTVVFVARLGMRHEGRFTGAQLGHRMQEIVVDLFAAYSSPVRSETLTSP